MVAINNLYMDKIPNSCKECPLAYLDTGDDAFFGSNERRCIIDGSCVDGLVSERAYDCPLIEAIPKAQCKANMIAMLEEIRAEIETKYGQCDICEYFEDYDYEENDISEYRPIGDIADILQIIDKYKYEMENT